MNDYQDLPDEDQFGDDPAKIGITVCDCQFDETYRDLVTGHYSLDIETEHSPEIAVPERMIDDQTSGMQIVEIRVLDENNQYVNFWVRVGKNRSNRVVCEVATNVGDRTVRKMVQAGKWRERRY